MSTEFNYLPDNYAPMGITFHKVGLIFDHVKQRNLLAFEAQEYFIVVPVVEFERADTTLSEKLTDIYDALQATTTTGVGQKPKFLVE